MNDYRESVLWFAGEMEAKLKENDHKGGWENCDLQWLYERMQEEMVELRVALQRGIPEDIISETADVANFAHMIADLARKRGASSDASLFRKGVR